MAETIMNEMPISIGDAEALVRWIKGGLPETIKGLCSKRSDFLYWIIINADMPEDIQSETLQHEILHIERHDFDSGRSVAQIESEVHQIIEARNRLNQKGA